jgi:negative regulator of sigma E activity
LKVRVLLLLGVAGLSVVAEPAAMPPELIVENYCAASRVQERSLQGASMEVEIEASLPKLKKQGRLHALRRISALGRITYEMLRFEGDGTVKKEVIARYLTAEAEAQKEQSPLLAVTPENYKFKYKGRNRLDGRDVHVFQVTPRKKRQGMFKGEVWIDAATYLRVQESGCLVKNPSIFLKRVEFVRKYEIRDGISVPRQVQSVVDTRLVGKAELTIDFTNFSIDGPKPGAPGEAGNQ